MPQVRNNTQAFLLLVRTVLWLKFHKVFKVRPLKKFLSAFMGREEMFATVLQEFNIIKYTHGFR